ncbi:MAG: helix-turn-helix domain-containing protein [Bacteroidaceae bacterium]|nr:helix-turn-helix domain-containing protein [Bacteroidaceae bacterium]
MKRYFYTRFCFLVTVLLTVAPLCAHRARFFGPDYLSSSLVTSILQTPDGLLWVGTENGLNRFDGYRFIKVSTIGTNTSPRPLEVTALCVDNEARLWVGTARGLLLHNRAEDRFTPVQFPDSLTPRVTTLQVLSDGQLSAGTSGYGFFLVDPEKLEAQPQTGIIPGGDEAFVVPQAVPADVLPLAPAGVFFTCSVKDAKGDLYIGTRGSGLYVLPAGTRRLQRVTDAVTGLDLNRARIQALFIDRRGNLWVGCQQKGLLMLPLQRRPLFQTWSFTAHHHEIGTCVSSIAQSPVDSLVWCTVQGDGVYGFSTDGRLVAHPSAPTGVETLMADSEGRFWLGSTNGLSFYQPSTGRVQPCEGIGNLPVNCMRELSDAQVAVSTFGSGLWLLDKVSGLVFRHLTMHDTDTVGRGCLSNDWIFSMDTDTRGRLWLGTSSGVCCYDPARHTFRPFGWDILLDREQCSALCVLRSDEVLMAGERGLFRWSRKDGLRPETGTEPLQGKTVSYIVEDAAGDIWLSTNEGIWQWQPQTRELVAYVGAYGLQEREYVRGAGWKGADGYLYFGTSDGITRFCPDSLRAERSDTASVHLTAFVIQGKDANTLTRSNGRYVMKAPVTDCREFSVSYVDATFRMEFSLLNFDGSEGVTYEYRVNREMRWQHTQKGENSIVFSHLAPGTYQLQVRAVTGGVHTPAETYIIEVRPPWWRSNTACAIYFLLLVALAVGFAVEYRRRIQSRLDQEKLHFLMAAINTQDAPLSLTDMKRAIGTFVQSRREQRTLYGNAGSVLDKMEKPEVRGNDEALMDRIIQSVNHHLDDSEFSVEQLCEEAGISRAHLHRKMKEMTGMPVTEFIRNIRLEQAARLLKERKLNVTQVAYSVGFSNLGYFSTVFRKHFGLTPREYVEQEEETEIPNS